MTSKQVPKGYTLITIAVVDEEKEKQNIDAIKRLIKEYELKKIVKECMGKIKKSDLPYRKFHLNFPY